MLNLKTCAKYNFQNCVSPVGNTFIKQINDSLYLAYIHHGMGIDEGRVWVKAKLQRSWQKL